MVLYLKLRCALVGESAGMRDVDGTATRLWTILYIKTKRWFWRRCSRDGHSSFLRTALSLVVVCHKSCCPPIDLLEFILIFLQVWVPDSTTVFHDRWFDDWNNCSQVYVLLCTLSILAVWCCKYRAFYFTSLTSCTDVARWTSVIWLVLHHLRIATCQRLNSYVSIY